MTDPLPYAYFGLIDLLQKIADPASNPNMDVGGRTMLDYWRADAARLLPSVKIGEIALDEPFHKLLHDAGWKAAELRGLRTEHRGPSANFPTMEKVQYAQDAAVMIDRLIEAILERAKA